MVYVQLFAVFFVVGLVSFGGGYAMIPLIHDFVVERLRWMTASEFTDMIAIAGMAPGPIAANSATVIGYHQAGLYGAMTASIGVVLPSFVIIITAALLYDKFQRGIRMQSALYGLRPVITGLILYAAFVMAAQNGLVAGWSMHTFSQLLIFLASLAALLFLRIHPLIVIIGSGLVGMLIYR